MNDDVFEEDSQIAEDVFLDLQKQKKKTKQPTLV